MRGGLQVRITRCSNLKVLSRGDGPRDYDLHVHGYSLLINEYFCPICFISK